MITIYQIEITDLMVDRTNREGFNAVPEVAAKTSMMFGSSKWNSDYAKYYTPAYEVDTDNLDHAFELTNLWEDMDRVTRLRRGSSSSVGDIFVKDGNCYLVDTFGFANIGKFELGA